MAVAIGLLTKVGARVESDQGLSNAAYPINEATADDEEVKVKSYDLIPFESEGIDDGHQWEIDNTIIGKGAPTGSVRVAKLPSGSISCPGFYDGLDALIGCALGAEKWNSPDYTIGSGAKVGTDGSLDYTEFSSLAVTFTSADVGKFLRLNMAGSNDNYEGLVRRVVSLISSHIIEISPAFGTAAINLGFELAAEFKHTFVPISLLQDILWTQIFTDYPLEGVGTANDKLLRRLTLCIAKAVSLWVYRSVMINSMKISGSARGGVKFEFDLLPFDRVIDSLTDGRQDGSTIEGWKSNLGWSASPLFTPAVNERIMFSDLTFRIGDYSTGTGLGSANDLGISAFEININNNLQGEDQDSVSGVYRKQPVRNGMLEVTGSITLPRYTADALLTKMNSDTVLMAHFNFTGTTIHTVSRSLQIWLPSLKITGHNESVGGAGIVQSVLNWSAFIPAGQAKNFPDYPVTDPNPPIIIQTINQNPFNIFRDQNEEY